jgi:phenylacetate-coenzyme A ligase PaaK-like adenylate-forming protein
VFGTALAQLRFGASIALGVPFALWSLDHLIDALLATRREFGTISSEGAEIIAGPTLDDETRRDMQIRRLRTQAQRAMREADYYAPLFHRLALDPARLAYEEIQRLPLTPKTALRDNPDAFVRRTAQPAFRTTTTGTTGVPTSVAFSDHEMQVYSALSAIAMLRLGELAPDDIVQISTSSRATLGNCCFALACQRIGALWYLGGLVDPALSLALLAEERHLPGKKRRTSFLSIYPSYLGELVETGLRLGYRPNDFGLERIALGGEIATAGLKDRCQELFGPIQISEGYGITEIWPVGGAICSQGHLHFEPSQGLLEVVSLPESSPQEENDNSPFALPRPLSSGEPGTIVATPFPPFRETTLVLRYDTQDIVRPVAGPLTCSLRHLPATTPILGKVGLSLWHEHGWTFPRQVMEALEAIKEVPLPARFGFWAVPSGVAVEVVARTDGPEVRRKIESALADEGVPVQELRLVAGREQLRHPYPLRCDLREDSFAPPPPSSAVKAIGLESVVGSNHAGKPIVSTMVISPLAYAKKGHYLP